jgi:hypothetical protein
MLILIPLKPVVLILGFLSGLIFVGFIGSSLLEKTNPFAVGASQMRHAVEKQNDSQATRDRAYVQTSARKRAH